MNVLGLHLPVWVSYVAGPLVGAIIGLITNGIAIRMLFRPLREVKIFGWTLPFTPGIIPKEKPRIARACGNVIGNTLLNEEVLSASLLSPEMEDKLHGTLNSFVENYKDSDKRIQDILTEMLNENKAKTLIEKSKLTLSELIYKKACTMGLGDKVATMAVGEVKNNPALTGFIMMFGQEAMNTIQKKIAGIVDEMIINQGEAVISDYINTEGELILNARICDLYEANAEKLPAVEARIMQAYHFLVTSSLSRILKAIDLPKLVEDRINSFDVLELEKILLELMDKELKAIVWLGGLLGLIMGIIMIFI